MANCRACYASITWADDEQGAAVPLDDHDQRDSGPGRYRIIQDGTRPVVAAIAENSPARTFVDHRIVCQQPRVI